MKKLEQEIPLEMRFGLAGKSKVRLENIKTPKFTTFICNITDRKKTDKSSFFWLLSDKCNLGHFSSRKPLNTIYNVRKVQVRYLEKKLRFLRLFIINQNLKLKNEEITI